MWQHYKANERNGESIRTHDVGAVTAAELVHAVRGRARAADAPGVGFVAGAADVAGFEGEGFGGWVGEGRGGGH
jgi:hypothetical protein